MDNKTRIENAKAKLKKAETARITAETQKAAALQQQEEIVKQMAVEGVTPETIKDTIAKLETEVNETLTKVETLMPKVV